MEMTNLLIIVYRSTFCTRSSIFITRVEIHLVRPAITSIMSSQHQSLRSLFLALAPYTCIRHLGKSTSAALDTMIGVHIRIFFGYGCYPGLVIYLAIGDILLHPVTCCGVSFYLNTEFVLVVHATKARLLHALLFIYRISLLAGLF